MNVQNTLKQNTPAILLAFGIGGFVGAVVYTAKVTPKANDILSGLPPDASKLDQARSIASTYAPVAGLVLASTGAILASNRIMRNRYAALLVLYSFTDQLVERWKASAQKEVNAKGFQKIKERVVGTDEDIPDHVTADDTKTIFYDNYSGRWFNTDSVETVRKVMNDINDTMYREDFVPVNDFYYGLQMDPVEYGNHVGWHIMDGSTTIELTPIIRDDHAYISISFNLKPRDYEIGI